jgi:hypothetical protein
MLITMNTGIAHNFQAIHPHFWTIVHNWNSWYLGLCEVKVSLAGNGFLPVWSLISIDPTRFVGTYFSQWTHTAPQGCLVPILLPILLKPHSPKTRSKLAAICWLNCNHYGQHHKKSRRRTFFFFFNEKYEYFIDQRS